MNPPRSLRAKRSNPWPQKAGSPRRFAARDDDGSWIGGATDEAVHGRKTLDRRAPECPRDAGLVERCPTKQKGFALASGIFLLVILAALGAFIVAISSTQHIGSALDVQGARAYQAARAGMEWGLYKQLRESTCDASSSFAFPATAAALEAFTVTVRCMAHSDANGGPDVYEIEATACNQPACPGTVGANYVERQMKVTF